MHIKKKILYLITQSELGGAQRYVFDLANNLRNDYIIEVAFGEQRNNGILAKKLNDNKIPHYTIPHLKRAISPINDLLALIKIIKLIRDTRPDIIHLKSSKISILGSLAGIFSRAKIIYTVHGWVFNEPLPIWKKLFYRYAEKFTALFKDIIICVSEFDRQTAIKEKICPKKKLVTIHNGIEPINYLPSQLARQKLMSLISGSETKIVETSLLIGTIGNLYETKGFEYLIEAIYHLNNKYKILSNLIIIGDGRIRQELKNLIAQLNMRSFIFLTGQINKAAQLLPAFDIYVCSSVKEGLSYTIIEAMQAGLPIIATKVGGNPELIEDDKTGVLLEPKNPLAIAEKIKELTANLDLRQLISAQAREKALNVFCLEKMLNKTKKAYLSLLNLDKNNINV